MGLHAIKMPDIGEGIAEVELVEWHVKPGDSVREDQVLVDVMTDKATVEIPSPVTGIVMQLGANAGELMAVGAELIRLEVAGEGNVKDSANAPASPIAVAIAEPARAREVEFAASPARPAEPRETQSHMHDASASTRPPGDKPIASPSLRRRAWDLGVELRFVNGSGPSGRITHGDLDAYIASRGRAPMSDPATAYAERHGEERHPVIGLRRKIAEKMQEAKRRIPHFSYVEEIDVTNIEILRTTLNEKYGAERGKLTMLPFIARAIVLALRDFPQMNARFDDDAGVVTRYSAVHLGIATQTPAGLVVPVVRHAEGKDCWSTSREIARLAQAARAGKATREELSGSTITISSLGPLGGIATTPVINHPEVAIIGVNKIVERPAFRHGQLAARKLMNLSSSFDHRVVDGADAAGFIQALRGTLETPALLFAD